MEKDNTLKNRLDPDMFAKLKSKKGDLKKQQESQKEAERQQVLREKKEKEANKSFSELLEETDLDWKNFK